MAEEQQLEYAYALQAIAEPKQWVGHQPMGRLWRQVMGGRMPSWFELNVALEVSGVVRKGWRMRASYRRSPQGLHPDMFSAGLFIDNARVLAFDSGKPSRHKNQVGIGEPYYRQRVDHPHWHCPVADASHGYVEPLDPDLSQASLWRMLLAHATIEGTPDFQPPPWEQGDLL